MKNSLRRTCFNMNNKDANSLRVAINVARHAREHGNHPFGAVLVDASGEHLLAAENSVITHKDATGHAEMNLVRGATWKYDTSMLKDSTLYASGEPCPMCAGAIVWVEYSPGRLRPGNGMRFMTCSASPTICPA